MIKPTNGINDRRPDKELRKQAFDVLEQIENFNADEKTKRQNREKFAWCKLIIGKFY